MVFIVGILFSLVAACKEREAELTAALVYQNGSKSAIQNLFRKITVSSSQPLVAGMIFINFAKYSDDFFSFTVSGSFCKGSKGFQIMEVSFCSSVVSHVSSGSSR